MYCASSRRRDRLGAAGVGRGGEALAAQDEDVLAGGVEGDAGGVPAGGDEAHRPALARPAHVHDRHRVVVGVRDEEGPAVGREGQGVGRAAQRRVGPQGHADLLDRLAGGEIHGPHRVRVGAGHEEAGPVAGEDHRVRVLADHDLAERPQGDAARRGPPGTRPTPRRRRCGRRATRASRTPRPAAWPGRARAPSPRPPPRATRRRRGRRRACARRARGRGRRRSPGSRGALRPRSSAGGRG